MKLREREREKCIDSLVAIRCLNKENTFNHNMNKVDFNILILAPFFPFQHVEESNHSFTTTNYVVY